MQKLERFRLMNMEKVGVTLSKSPMSNTIGTNNMEVYSKQLCVIYKSKISTTSNTFLNYLNACI